MFLCVLFCNVTLIKSDKLLSQFQRLQLHALYADRQPMDEANMFAGICFCSLYDRTESIYDHGIINLILSFAGLTSHTIFKDAC